MDAYRSWDKRDIAELGGRTGFIRLAIREGVPIESVIQAGMTRLAKSESSRFWDKWPSPAETGTGPQAE